MFQKEKEKEDDVVLGLPAKKGDVEVNCEGELLISSSDSEAIPATTSSSGVDPGSAYEKKGSRSPTTKP